MRSKRFTFFSLVVLLLLLTGTTSVLARVVSSSSTFLHRSLEMRIGLFALGNPIEYTDPTGRIATSFAKGATMGDYYESTNTTQAWGKGAGQFVAGLVPYYGQVADARDVTAAWNVGRTQGWSFGTSASLAMAGVAFVPAVGDFVRSAVKPLIGSPAGQAGVKALHGGPSSAVAKALPAKLYHYTGQGNAANILEHGLQPGAISGKVFTTPAGACRSRLRCIWGYLPIEVCRAQYLKSTHPYYAP